MPAESEGRATEVHTATEALIAARRELWSKTELETQYNSV